MCNIFMWVSEIEQILNLKGNLLQIIIFEITFSFYIFSLKIGSTIYIQDPRWSIARGTTDPGTLAGCGVFDLKDQPAPLDHWSRRGRTASCEAAALQCNSTDSYKSFHCRDTVGSSEQGCHHYPGGSNSGRVGDCAPHFQVPEILEQAAHTGDRGSCPHHSSSTAPLKG